MPLLYSGKFLLLSLMNLLFVSGTAAFNLLPLFIREIGGTESTIGFIMGIAGTAGVISRLLAGDALDRVGRKPFLLGSGLCLVIAPLLYLEVDRIGPILMLLRVLHGAALGTYFASSFTLVADTAPRGRLAQTLGLYGISGLLGSAVGPAGGEFFFQRFGPPGLFMWAVSLSAGGLLILPFTGDSESFVAVPRKAVAKLARASLFTGVMGVIFGFASSIPHTFVADYVKVRGLPYVGPFFIAYSGAAAFVRLFSGSLFDRFARLSMALPAFVSYAIGLVLLSLSGSTSILVMAGLISGGSHGILYPIIAAMAVEKEGAHHRGHAISFATAAIELGNMAGAFLIGIPADMVGYPLTFLLVSSGLTLFAVVVWVTQGMVKRHER